MVNLDASQNVNFLVFKNLLEPLKLLEDVKHNGGSNANSQGHFLVM